jgi:hypothetical protein
LEYALDAVHKSVVYAARDAAMNYIFDTLFEELQRVSYMYMKHMRAVKRNRKGRVLTAKDNDTTEDEMIEYKLKVVREAVGQNKAQVVSDIFNAVMVNITETLETARVALREAIELGVDLKNSDQLLITHLTSTGEVDILKFMKEYMRTHNIVEQEIASAEKIVELYIKTESKVLENHMVTIVEEEEEECEKKKKFCYLYLISFEKGPETLLNGYIALAEAAPSSVSSSSVLYQIPLHHKNRKEHPRLITYHHHHHP